MGGRISIKLAVKEAISKCITDGLTEAHTDILNQTRERRVRRQPRILNNQIYRRMFRSQLLLQYNDRKTSIIK